VYDIYHIYQALPNTQTDTKLADRTATISKEPAADLASQVSNPAGSKDKAQAGADQRSELSALLNSLREDLAEAQRMRAELQSQLDAISSELAKLKEKSAADVKKVGDLITERNQLMVRLRDRDEELRGKSKLLEVSLATLLPYVCAEVC
jgi:chromosome segregation ATPase